jgi:hypothetical protein
MSSIDTGRRLVLSVAALALACLSIPLAAQGRVVKPKVPKAITGTATHVLGTSALLTATINPNGQETGYYFQYGTTTAYGLQTPPASAGSSAKIKVGQAVSGLQAGATYHYRVVATTSAGPPILGLDRIFTTKGSKLRVTLAKPATDVFGSPIILSGTLTGFGSANHRIALQASPFPYLEAFTTIGSPGASDASGRFSFRVANLSVSTQFRVATLDPLPLYSATVLVPVAVRVSFSARASQGAPGLVRLYGTVSPAVSSARVVIQVQKAVRPGRNEATNRYVKQFLTSLKRATHGFSRFSTVVKLKKSGRYRVFVEVRSGGLVSGFSRRTIVLRAK